MLIDIGVRNPKDNWDIKNKHQYEYDRYFDDIESIIEDPDYYGINPTDGNVMLIKEYEFSGNKVRIGIKIEKKINYI